MCNTLYFGYGTFLDDDELYYYLPNAEKVTTARAMNRKFVLYSFAGDDFRGYCHITDKLDAMGEITHGIIARHDPKYFVDYPGFERCFLTVYGDDGKMYDCWTLRMNSLGSAVRPPDYYWNHILKGLKEYNFSEAYTQKIIDMYEKALPCSYHDMKDPKS